MECTTTFSEARARFAHFYDVAVDDREVVIVRRRGKPNLALIAEDDLSSLLETALLFRSPANTAWILAANDEFASREIEPQTVEELWTELGLDG